MKPITFLMLTGALAIATPALSQDQTPPVAAIPVGTHVGTPASGYDDGGRRDPFGALVQPKRTNLGASLDSLRPRAGLAAMALSDVTVRGIVGNGKVMLAILEAPNKQSFVARLQDKLLDGWVKSIDRDGVVFISAADPGGQASSEVRKNLRPAGEGVR